MTSAIGIITERVRDRVRRDGVDLSRDGGVADRYVRDEVRAYSERALGGSVPLLADEASTHGQVLASITGFGPLQPYLDDPDVEEMCAVRQSCDRITARIGGGPHDSAAPKAVWVGS